MLPHHRHEYFRAQKQAVQIDFKCPTPGFEIHLVDMHVGVDAGIVDQNIAAAKPLLHDFAGSLPVFFVTDITVNCNGLAAGLLNQFARLRQVGDIQKRYRRAALGELKRQFLANTFCRTRNHCDAIFMCLQGFHPQGLRCFQEIVCKGMLMFLDSR